MKVRIKGVRKEGNQVCAHGHMCVWTKGKMGTCSVSQADTGKLLISQAWDHGLAGVGRATARQQTFWNI